MKKFLLAVIPLLLLTLTLPALHTSLTANAQEAPAPPDDDPTDPPPTVALWGEAGPTPDFWGVRSGYGDSKVLADKLDHSANPPRFCLYWPRIWGPIRENVRQKNFDMEPDYPLPGQEEIFVYKDARWHLKDIALDLANRYTDYLDSIGASETAAIAASLSANNNNNFVRLGLISPNEYVCADPSDRYCMHWHDKDYCPTNHPQSHHEFAQCAAWDEDGSCKAVLTSLSNNPIETEPGALIKAIFLVTLSLAGGISVILIIIAGYKILTSNGKPEAIQAGRDQLTSAIVGLLFIIFSYVIFQFIVADLLRIPGITS